MNLSKPTEWWPTLLTHQEAKKLATNDREAQPALKHGPFKPLTKLVATDPFIQSSQRHKWSLMC